MIEHKVKVYKNGDKAWYLDGKLHREDGPAIEWSNGEKAWYLNGKRHRKDGPAIERLNGNVSWWLNDKLHREDGPAVEYADGTKEWWVDGKKLSEEEFTNNNNRKLNKIKMKECLKQVLEYLKEEEEG